MILGEIVGLLFGRNLWRVPAILWLIGISGYPAGFQVMAQRSSASLFMPFSWEQACLQAAREHKLVLVEAGDVSPDLERRLQVYPELVSYLKRNIVAIRMDMNSVQGREFLPRLLLHPYPLFAFFMPYGDLVGTVAPQSVLQNPESLREACEESKAVAEIKKSNSRAVSFVRMDFVKSLERAADEGKELFVFLSDERNQASLLLEYNVFTLNKVADFLNQHFVNLRLSGQQRDAFCHRYGVGDTTLIVFLNDKGKMLFSRGNVRDADMLISYAGDALEQAKGIPFCEFTSEEALQRAREQGKQVFTDYYVQGEAHRQTVADLYTDPEVAAYFREHFICVSCEAGRACLVFTDSSGRELHRVLKADSPEELLEEAGKALTGRGVADMRQRYRGGDREDGFLEEYINMLGKAGMTEEADSVLQVYFAGKPPALLMESHYWEMLVRYCINPSPVFFDYILMHRNELYDLYGESAVRKKVAALWVAGAENFVHGGQFDEAGFKAYAKRLRKEKVEDARLIIRNARMRVAEKLGDWKVFVMLAEEKLVEEQVTDAELYDWGVKIEERCSDGGLRYKMAQWLGRRAVELGRKERDSGKVNVASYRGFFEKLADDLLKRE